MPKSLVRVRPAGTLPWLVFSREQPNSWFSPASIADSMHWMVLHRPVELAEFTVHVDFPVSDYATTRPLGGFNRIVGRTKCRNYSYFSATIGSTRIARRAGTQHAASVTTRTRIETPANVSGSVALTSNNRLDMNRVSASDAATPIAMPTTANLSAWAKTSRITCPRSAPSAMRIPISCVRCATLYEITPYIPTSANSTPMAPRTVRTDVWKRGAVFELAIS